MATGINFNLLFDSLLAIAKDKNIGESDVIDILKFALEKAYLKERPDSILVIDINVEKKSLKIHESKTVVEKSEDEIDDDIEINLEEAQKIKSKINLGEELLIPIDINDLEKRVVGHVQHLFNQKLNEILNKRVFDSWKDKIGTVVRAEIERIDNSLIVVNLGETMGVLLRNEQIPSETLMVNQKYTFLIKDVKEQAKGWPIILSRADSKFLEFLLRSNIPEIESGLIEIKMIARVPGYKAKIVVATNDTNIDPIGTIVGVGGKRIKDISAMIGNERIDVINYSDNPKQLLINAFAPERILGLEMTDDEDGRIVTVVADEAAFPKLVGKNGINVKLISRLTHWSIDVVQLGIAIEDKINFEDVRDMQPIKFVNQNRSSLSGSNWKQQNDFFKSKNPNKGFFNNNKKEFDNNSFDPNQAGGNFEWDSNMYKQAEQITDEDIENLLDFNVGANKKKKKVNQEQEFGYETNKKSDKKKNETDILDEHYDDLNAIDYQDDDIEIDFDGYDDLE